MSDELDVRNELLSVGTILSGEIVAMARVRGSVGREAAKQNRRAQRPRLDGTVAGGISRWLSHMDMSILLLIFQGGW